MTRWISLASLPYLHRLKAPERTETILGVGLGRRGARGSGCGARPGVPFRSQHSDRDARTSVDSWKPSRSRAGCPDSSQQPHATAPRLHTIPTPWRLPAVTPRPTGRRRSSGIRRGPGGARRHGGLPGPMNLVGTFSQFEGKMVKSSHAPISHGKAIWQARGKGYGRGSPDLAGRCAIGTRGTWVPRSTRHLQGTIAVGAHHDTNGGPSAQHPSAWLRLHVKERR